MKTLLGYTAVVLSGAFVILSLHDRPDETKIETKPYIDRTEKLEKQALKMSFDQDEENSLAQLEAKLDQFIDLSLKTQERLTRLELAAEQVRTKFTSAEELAAQTTPSPTVPVSSLSTAETFESAFEQESVDESWSSQAQENLSSALESLRIADENVVIHNVACQASMCKASYQLPSVENVQKSVESIGHALEWEAKSYTEYEVDEYNQVQIASYYMRENFDLPEAFSMRDE